MSESIEHLELMNTRLRVMEVHLADIRQTLMDIRDAVLIIGERLPAPMHEDATREAHHLGGSEVRRGTLYRQGGPAPDVVPGPEQARPSERVMQMVNCDHNWPAELTPDSECPDCGMTYKYWSAASNR